MKVMSGWVGLLLMMSATVWALGQNTQSEKREFEETKSQAERGDPRAQLALGNFYAFGTGVTRDLAKAVKWHRKAAEQGLAQAQLRLAYEYLNGFGIKPDPIEGAIWLHRAADQKLAEAEYQLARCYAEGQGVGENPVTAASWYRKAADQDFLPAQYALGTCYFEGYGVTKDIPEGVTWTRKAAEAGYAEAENSYGMCFAKGKGVPQDYLQAYKWFNLAAAQGGEHNTEAKMNLSMAERAMTPAQIAEAQKLALEFKPRTPPAQSDRKSSNHQDNNLQNGRLAIVSVNAGDESSEVYVDGAFVGNSPAKLKLEPGLHVVEVKKQGFKEYRRELKATEGAELNLRPVLQKD